MELGAVVGTVDRARGNEDDITRRNVVGSVLNEVVALALSHVVELKHTVVVLGSDATSYTFSFIKIIVSVITGKQCVHVGLPQLNNTVF